MPNTYAPSRLDQALFAAPYIVIDGGNAAHTITRDLDDAVDILNTDLAARAIVGTLRQPMLAIDIDPEDTSASAEAGDVVAEQLILWADRYGLPWLRRASGRRGHTHLIIKTPPYLRQELQVVVRAIATRQDVSATLRSTLRLTSSPHRHDLPSPIVSCTLTTADAPRLTDSKPARARQPARRRGGVGRSRSEGEYGHALALARAGHTTAHAWAFANLTGTKARDIGEKAWRRWFWAPATTIAAAESGLPEQQAWDLFHQASPTQAVRVGRDAWRQSRWLPALREAQESRPRRRRIGPHHPGERPNEPSLHRLRRVQAVLRAAIDRHLARSSGTTTRTGTIAGVRVTSLRAALDAFAHAVLSTRGSISIRHWAERAGLDPKTVRRARDAAIALGILRRVHQYAGGDTDCDAFASIDFSDSTTNREPTSPTSYTPTLGGADVLRLQWQHHQDRTQRKRTLSEVRWFSTKIAVPSKTDTDPSVQIHQNEHSLPVAYTELRERKWNSHHSRAKDSHPHNDRSAHALQHTHRGRKQSIARNELLRHVRQHLTGSSDLSTLTANSMKQHESNVRTQLNAPTFSDLLCSAPALAAEGQQTTGRSDGHQR